MSAVCQEPASRGDENRLSSARKKLCEEDVSFKVTRDPQTKELVISGLVTCTCGLCWPKWKTGISPPSKPSRQRFPIAKRSPPKPKVNYRHKKQTVGAGQYR
jgi:elongation factor G